MFVLSIIFELCSLFLVDFTTSTDGSCNFAKQCVNSTTNITGRFQSHGYKSNYGSESYVVSDSTWCNGVYSCYQAQILSESEVECNGIFACSSSNSIVSKSEDVECHASTTCYYSNLQSLKGSIQCKGDQSCAQATITQTSNVYSDGAFSLYEATIYSIGNNTNLTVILYGYYSGMCLAIFIFICLCLYFCLSILVFAVLFGARIWVGCHLQSK